MRWIFIKVDAELEYNQDVEKHEKTKLTKFKLINKEIII